MQINSTGLSSQTDIMEALQQQQAYYNQLNQANAQYAAMSALSSLGDADDADDAYDADDADDADDAYASTNSYGVCNGEGSQSQQQGMGNQQSFVV